MRVAAAVAMAVLCHGSLLLGLAAVTFRQARAPARPASQNVEVEAVSGAPARASRPSGLRPAFARRPPWPSASARSKGAPARAALAPAPRVPPVSVPAAAAPVPGGAPTGEAPPSGSTTADSSAPAVGARYRSHPAPPYPSDSLRLREEGLVTLSCEVGADGATSRIAVSRSSGHPALDDAAVRAVAGWTFEPARVAGAAVASRVIVPVRFSLVTQ